MAVGRVTGWIGWIWFAGIMIIMVGVFNAINGLVAIFNHAFFARIGDQVLLLNLTGWGWVHLIIGLALIAVGVALFMGQTWARIVAIVLVALNAIAHMLSLTAYPVWSVLVIAIDVFVLYALIVHGNEARAAMR
jgi:hypothetical protein